MFQTLRSPVIAAVIFDVDGVLTNTAGLHEAAWKQVFDEFLARRGLTGSQGSLFTSDDYRRYVDGRPRTDGVASFLGSRHIPIPSGDPSDDPGKDTVVGIARRKDQAYAAALQLRGPGPFPSSLTLVRALVEKGVRTAFVSGSRHAADVVRAAGMESLFQAHVDGFDAERLALAGKPDPATFLEAARRLGTVPAETAIVEDALSGVEAGKRGGFALVVGVDRVGQGAALARNGADAVVADLGELALEAIHPGRVHLNLLNAAGGIAALSDPGWTWSYSG
ncbi:MAG TPA: HAD-IA family hydrolase, partial [Candidatus Dormibacteraeota bacterium]